MSPTEAGFSVVHWSGRTHPGRIRPRNEDAFLALKFDAREVHRLGKDGWSSLSQADYVFAVSDGMRGGGSGEFASRVAVEKITELLPRSFRSGAKGLPTGFPDDLNTVFERIHADLTAYGRVYEECRGMGATLSLLWISPSRAFFGHVGDSRIYHLPAAGGMRQVTPDDTHVGWLRREGKINEREQRMHPRRTSLQRALGGGFQFLDPHLGVIYFTRGDRFVLCTDGLIDGLWDRQIDEFARSDRIECLPTGSVTEEMIAEANRSSGRDNSTVIVIGIG